MATAQTPQNAGQLGQDIAEVRNDLGRTVAEIGARLTPAHLMDQAKQGLLDSARGATQAVTQSAQTIAGDVASRTRGVALDARDQARAHPYAAGAIVAGLGVGYWLATSGLRRPKRLVPREWDEPFDRSSRRRTKGPAPSEKAPGTLPLAAAVAAAVVFWRNRI